MSVFHCSQYDHEPFWSYFSRLSDFHAQLVNYMFEKWEICEVVYIGVNEVTSGILNSICFLSKTPDQAWNLLEQLGWDSY